jgi:hypothetical protein
MISQISQTQEQSFTSKGLDFFFGGGFTSSPLFNFLIIDEKTVTLFEIEPALPKKKLKGWGLFKGLKIEEEEIEEAKKSLFPEREF